MGWHCSCTCCIAGAGTAWSASPTEPSTATTQIQALPLGYTGSSGMLRFRSGSGALFAVAVGVHDYKCWCDVQVDLADTQPLTQLHGAYYTEGTPRAPRCGRRPPKPPRPRRMAGGR